MKKLIQSLFILLFVGFSSANAQISTTGLVAKWKFNGNLNDSSGKGLNGIQHGKLTYTTGKKGLPNTAVQINGDSGYVAVKYDTSFNFKKYSICAIVKHTKFYTGACQGNALIVRGGPQPGHWGLNANDNAYNDCSVADTNKYIYSAYVGSVGPSPSSTEQYSPNLHTNKWYCMVAVYDSLNVKIYADGALMVSYWLPASHPGVGSSTDSLGIGIDLFAGGHSFPFYGVVDDIRLYNRPLTASEVNLYCTHSGDDTAKSTESVYSLPFGNYNVELYPNPAHDYVKLQIDYKYKNEIKQYVVYNAVGQVVKSGSFEGEFTEIDTRSYHTGVYSIRVSVQGYVASKHFVVQ